MLDEQEQARRDDHRPARGRPRLTSTCTAPPRSRRPTTPTSCASPASSRSPPRGRAVEPRHHRPLRAEARDLRHPRAHRARQGRRDPADRRAAGAGGATSRARAASTASSSAAVATTPATGSTTSRPSCSSPSIATTSVPSCVLVQGVRGDDSDDGLTMPRAAVTRRSATATVTIRPIRQRDARALEQELLANRALAAPVGGDEPRRPDLIRHARRASAACSPQYRDGPRRCRSSWSTTARWPGQLNVSGIARGSLASATIGYWVSQRFAGRGITPTAVALATDFCFSELRLHRMEICIRPENGAVAARRREARLPLRGAASAVHPHQRRLARPLRVRARRRGGAAGRAPALARRPGACRCRTGPRRRPRRVRVSAAAGRSLNTPAPARASGLPCPSVVAWT